MKKIVCFSILCLFFSTMVFSQISTIQTKSVPFELFGNGLVFWKETGKITLDIKSDNQFEEKRAELNLGNNPLEAIQSLENLKAAITQPDATFEVDGYSFLVFRNGASILNVGKLEHTAGSYNINERKINEAIFSIIEKFNVEYGEPEVVVRQFLSTTLTLDFSIPKFNTKKDLTLYTSGYKEDFKSYFSFADGDVLNTEQKLMISSCIKKGIIKSNDKSDFYISFIPANDSVSVESQRKAYRHHNGKLFLFPSSGMNVNYDPILNWGITEIVKADGTISKMEHFYLKVVSPNTNYHFDSGSKMIFTLSDGREIVLNQILLTEVVERDESYWIQSTRVHQFGTYARFILDQDAKAEFLNNTLEVVKVTIVFAKDEKKEYELKGKQVSRFTEKIKESYMESIEVYKKSKKTK